MRGLVFRLLTSAATLSIALRWWPGALCLPLAAESPKCEWHHSCMSRVCHAFATLFPRGIERPHHLSSHSYSNRPGIGAALRRFKKLLERSGVTKELRKRKYYEKPCELRRRAKMRKQSAIRKSKLLGLAG